MGILLTADEAAPIPRKVDWTFTCDGDHGLLPAPVATFLAYSEAMKAGWKEWSGPTGEQRLFLGPCCSGKAAR